MYIYIYIYIYTYIACYRQNAPFARALATRPGSNNFYPPPYLALRRLTSPHVLFSGGVFFSQTPVRGRKMAHKNRLLIRVPG